MSNSFTTNPVTAPGRNAAESKNLFSPPEACDYMGNIVDEQTLANWRCTKRYPLPFVRIGRRIAYRRADLDAFLESRTVRPVNTAAA